MEGFPVGLQRVLIIHCRQTHESVYNCNGGGKDYSTSVVSVLQHNPRTW